MEVCRTQRREDEDRPTFEMSQVKEIRYKN